MSDDEWNEKKYEVWRPSLITDLYSSMFKPKVKLKNAWKNTD